jgi:hypothetical protein
MNATHELFVSPVVADPGQAARTTTVGPPLQNLQQAAALARPGTVIQLAAGRYGCAELRNLAGTPEAPIIIRGPATPPIDFSVLATMDQSLYVEPLREAMADGRFTLADDDQRHLAVISTPGSEIALALYDCTHVRIENLVLRDARANLLIQRSTALTVRDCVMTGTPPHSVAGVVIHRNTMAQPPSQYIEFQRVAVYGLQENGFVVHPGAAFDVQWRQCVAHSMESHGGDGFSFSHVTPTDPPRQTPCRAFPDGINYRFLLYQCAALNNRLDGFDLGHGVGGVTLDLCLGDGNGHGAYYAKDIKVWSSNNTLRRTRMTGRILFVSGTNTLEDFKTGCKQQDTAD